MTTPTNPPPDTTRFLAQESPSVHNGVAPVHNGAATGSPLLYTPAEAAEKLATTESWLRRKAGLRLIPCTFIGKRLRFSDADLQAIVASGSRPADTQLRRTRRTCTRRRGRPH
ncbi:helix-turn-helix domain-containing protein [Amycolatopsis pithecellobii]|uniref:helix-turn-helix domain-containing protein n=1 Tax=Amycolatopsis pithecellobii TaxID=664692 RepID=UPI001AA06748|nr:helix-turn-helix domain-containing protein [Amycolatopsis pithecellobii]